MGMWTEHRMMVRTSLALGLTIGTPALGQVVKKGTLSGTLLSGAATAGPGASATILTAGMLATFGSQARENQSGPGLCADLSPGLVLPAGEVLSCSDLFGTGSASCGAMAIVSRK